MYLMITMYLCDHRNCTVEMIIGPMKNPVNHKHHHAWYSNIRFTMYFLDNVQSEAVDQFQHRQLRSCLELIYTNRINSK